MFAEHIIGLLPTEYSDPEKSASDVRTRFERIKKDGILKPAAKREFMGTSNSFDLDFLAGDNQYVFLSAGSRYRNERPDCVCYGFVFDAADLINYGALVGPDLANEYDALLDSVVRQVEAILPPLSTISDSELAEFAEAMGITDSAMLAHLRDESTSRYHDLIRAVEDQDASVEGATEAIGLFKAGAQKLQSEMRFSGAEAIARLEKGMEILVPRQLPLALAKGTIECGVVK